MISEKELQLFQKEKGFSIVESGSQISMEGMVNIDHEYDGVRIIDSYRIRILIPEGFPQMAPLVMDIDNHVPKEFEHFYDSGYLCMGAICEQLDFLEKHPSLGEFFDEIVSSYLYSASFFRMYGYAPYGERSHGILGIIESYYERYNAGDETLLIQLLMMASGITKFRGHSLCPCGSGKKLRNCHGKMVLHDLKSKATLSYRLSALTALEYFLDGTKKGRELRIGKTNPTKKLF